MKGTFITMPIQKAKSIEHIEALKVFGVRSAKFLPEGWVHYTNLAPSLKLFFDTQKLKKLGNWNQESFNEHYLPRFINEIKQNEDSKKELQMYINLLKEGKDVYFSCYCSDYNMCHRGLIAKILENNGYNVKKG